MSFRSVRRDPLIALACVASLAVVLSGCLGGDEPNPDFVATATGGVLFDGWDYEGASRTVVNAALHVDVDEEANTGVVRLNATSGNDTITIELTEFTHNADDFHSGGIAANFDEHGDTGVGNALLPKMHLLIATWGPGKVLVNGNASVDPYTGEDTWDAHLMVTDTGIRDDGKVTKADGSGAYDPNDPGNARIGTDNEAHLVLTSRFLNESLPPMNQTVDGSVDGPIGSLDIPIDIPVAGGVLIAEIDFGMDPNEAGTRTVSLRDPAGNSRSTVAVNRVVPTAPGTATLQGAITEPGTWTVRVSTNAGGPADFTGLVTVTFPPKPMFYFFWEDVEIEKRVVG